MIPITIRTVRTRSSRFSPEYFPDDTNCCRIPANCPDVADSAAADSDSSSLSFSAFAEKDSAKVCASLAAITELPTACPL